MASDDRAAGLDAAIDAVIAGRAVEPGLVPEEQAAILRRLHDRWQQPAPDPAFVRRLGWNLAAVHPQASGDSKRQLGIVFDEVTTARPASIGHRDDPWTRPHRRRWLPLAFAALAICAALVVAALIGRDDDRPETIPAAPIASPPVEHRGVLLMIDTSGSMSYDPLGETSKIEMEKAAARAALAGLAPGDWFGVLAFNDEQTWLVPLAPLGGVDQREGAAAAIDGLGADGGSEPYPALLVAIDALKAAEPPEKHLIILSDGKSRTGTPEQYREAAQAAASGGIVISTVAIGSDADTSLMQTLAEAGGGRYHLAERAEDIVPGVELILGFSTATPASEWIGYAPLEGTPATQTGLPSTAVAIEITVDGNGLLRGDAAAEEEAVAQLEAALAPFVEAGCRIGFVIAEGSAPDVATGNRIADAVNRLLQEESPELTEGAGYYSVANTGQPVGSVNLFVFPNAGCDVA